MKRIALISIKVLLLALFLQNIGFYSFIANHKQEIAPPRKADNGQADIQYLNRKLARAEKLSRHYGPEEYFADLTEIRIRQKNNDLDYNAKLQADNVIGDLLSVFDRNLKSVRRYSTDNEYQNYLVRVTIAQKKHINLVDPEIQRQEEISRVERQQPGYWSNLIVSVLSWLAHCYSLNFPLALVLLWLWWYQEKEKLSINNPLSFLICLILYPIVLVRVWSRSLKYGARIFALGIEFKRRQVNLFSMISDDEWSLLKKYAHSEFKISAYRQHFENLGLVRQHALLPAMIVIIIFMFAPKLSIASYTETPASQHTCSYQIKAPPSITLDDSNSIIANLCGTLVSVEEVFIPLLTAITFIAATPKHCSGFATNPDPVPLFG